MKGNHRTIKAKAVFFNRLGEMRDRSFESQRYRASGLNLLVAADKHCKVGFDALWRVIA